jgi:NADH:ubiquinone oxidoreductase subunit K
MDFALIGGLNFSMAMLSAPLVTILARRLGIHTSMSIEISLQTSGFIAASYATRVWHLYLSQSILIRLGVGYNYIPGIAILSQWFQRCRSLANTISGAGSGVGGLLFFFVVRAAISNLCLA